VRACSQAFVGRWRLLLAFDDVEMPKLFRVELLADHKFATVDVSADSADSTDSTDGANGAPTRPMLGGSWGLYDTSMTSDTQRKEAADGFGRCQLGTHFFMRVDRLRCTSTLRGLADTGIFEDFSLWGKPEVGTSPLAELAARSEAGGTSDELSGRIYFGVSLDREYFVCGRFSLLREEENEGA
jgi:hypothetical protein